MLLRLITCLIFLSGIPLAAQEISIEQEVRALADGGYDDKAQAIQVLAKTGHPRVSEILAAMRGGGLFLTKSDERVVIGYKDGDGYLIRDAITDQVIGIAGRRDVTKIRVNNRLRRTIDEVTGALALLSPDPALRLKAATSLVASAGKNELSALDAAIANEHSPHVKEVLEAARAAALLRHEGASEEERFAAVSTVAALNSLDANALLRGIADGEGPVAEEAGRAMVAIERELAMWDAGQHIAYGLSLGSVLLLAAIGLAITFGVMGVINLAHGEMVMLGAYTTFVVQDIIRNSAPQYFDYSLLMAIPLAFLVAGAVGVAMERGIIRWLYGRPLETLLATWGISLILQQSVRTIFGPTNKEVGNPSWMSGSVEIGQMVLTWNRIWIFVFALIVFFALLALLKKTRFGLYTRAVTQNREMASAMGIRTGWIDAMTFGLGSGIAGLAGVALSQIDNVSPNLGQSYIIDSFLVVVFGGVGNLWGTLTGAMTLGIVNKFLEPYAGAVLGKILVLVFIILFIQKRPRGLFALKGRAVES